MVSKLLDSLVFDINGTLITSQGQLPNFERRTVANAEFTANGSLRIVPTPAYQPRFSSEGSLVLEQGATNYCTHPINLIDASWVKGSSIAILPDRVVGMWGTYNADRVSVSSTLGNADAQTLYKDIYVGSGIPLVITFYLRLASGRFGPNDRLTITQDVTANQTTYLAPIFNDKQGNYIPVTLYCTTAGTAPADYGSDTDVNRTVRISLYVENSVSIDWGGVQIERGTIRTSFIDQADKVSSRDDDTLEYAASPVTGLASFFCYMNLEQWRGNGLLVQGGDFKLEIVGGKLRATCNSVTVEDPDALPNAAKIACRVSQGLERVQIYVNGTLKAREILSGYIAGSGKLTVCGQGVRQLRCLYLFNRDVGDGSVDIGGSVLGEMGELFRQDTLFAELSEGFGRITFPPVRILPGRSVRVKMPSIRAASQIITNVTSGSSAVAQVERVEVFAVPSASNLQRDTTTINDRDYETTSDATPNVAEVATLQARLIESDVDRVVNVTYTPGNAYFDLTAIVPGDGFYISASQNLVVTSQTPNSVGTKTLTVSNAVDYQLGEAAIYRDNTWIADIRITARNTGANTLTVTAEKDSDFYLIGAGDYIVQSSWQVAIGRNSYMAHHLEDFPDIKVREKLEAYFALENIGKSDRTVTPYLKAVL